MAHRRLNPWLVSTFLAAAIILGFGTMAQAQYYAPPPPPPQYYYAPPPPPPAYSPPPPYYVPVRPLPPQYFNDLRLQIGVAGTSSGYYCGYGYYGGGCNTWFSTANLDARIALEIVPQPPLAVTLGVDILPSLNSGNYPVYVEPTLDIGASLQRPRNPIRSRFYLGIGVPIGTNGQVGVVGRFGGGISANLGGRLALGIDFVWSLGSINNYFVNSLNFTAGPEIRF